MDDADTSMERLLRTGFWSSERVVEHRRKEKVGMGSIIVIEWLKYSHLESVN